MTQSKVGESMNERQRMVCAGALWADGYSHDTIAAALGVTRDESVMLAGQAADEQNAGTLGHMAATRDENG